MADVPTYLRRPTAILLMPDAISRGLTVTGFIREAKAKGISYRRTRMLADWHNVAGTETRKDRYKYVRKDRQLSSRLMADVDWEMSKEYMFKFKVWVSTREGEPLTERIVNIPHDRNLTPTELQAVLFERWSAWEKYQPERIAKFELIGAWHKVEGITELTPSPFESD